MSRSPRVLVGVTGGIAAFKSAELVRRLQERGCEVRCALTRAGEAFVTPLTLEVLSGAEVYREEYLSPGRGGRELHIDAAAWAEALVVAPATAHALARLALGLADDFLSTTALAFDGPLLVAPAMHQTMWSQPAVAGHVATLAGRGVRVVGPERGRLASGETGAGRMAEPETIADAVLAALDAARAPRPLAGRTVVVAAGPTRERLDPVRFLSNRSSGKMGFALAAAAAAAGARTVLVAGPVALATPAGVERVDVESALEMREAVHAHAAGADLVVMAAAVSDFRPRAAAAEKLKKRDGLERLELEPNPDILAELPAVAPAAVRVGFAAETGDPEAEARRKLADKGAQFLVANDVSRAGVGFGSDDNEVVVYREEGAPVALERQSKERLAGRLMELFTGAVIARGRQDAPVAG